MLPTTLAIRMPPVTIMMEVIRALVMKVTQDQEDTVSVS